jgi:hypothetical protein
MGLEIVSMNRVGTAYGKESPVAHQMSILKGGIDFSSITWASQFQQVRYEFITHLFAPTRGLLFIMHLSPLPPPEIPCEFITNPSISSLGRYVFGSEISYNKAPPRLPGLGC